MQSDYQLSFLDIDTDSQGKSDIQTAKQNPDITALSNTSGNADGPLSYADIKGRVSIPQKPLSARRTRSKAIPPSVRHLKGYDAPPMVDERYLSVHEVARRFSVSKATIWRWTKDNSEFPKPVALYKGTSRWRLSDLIAFEIRSMGA